jgi:AcrR family transcriptional regulator
MRDDDSLSSAAHLRPEVSEPSSSGDDRADKRGRILAAGLSLFAHQPYQEVTMDSVAKLAGVAKGTLYLYFDSKEALYLGILSDGLEKAVQHYAVDAQADIAQRLRAAIAASIHFYERHRDFLQLLATEEPRMAAARSRLVEGFRQRGFDYFSSLIEEGMEQGIFRRTDSRMATFAILGAIRSVLLYYSGREAPELSRDLSQMILEGLMNGPRAGRRGSAAK